jgi:methionyl-tRNA formyltransferase
VKTIFIGGLTNGRVALSCLKNIASLSLPLIFTHPKDVEAPRAVDIGEGLGERRVRYGKNVVDALEDIRTISPDLIVVAGWSWLIPQSILEIPPLGVVGFHPSRLPADRGRSVLAWQIEEGYTKTALTMFYYTPEPDAGDIIDAEGIPINESDYIGDLLDKVDVATGKLMENNMAKILNQTIIRKKQDHTCATVRILRTDAHSQINWESSAVAVYNKIRAISRPYPGATGSICGVQYRIWRAIPLSLNGTEDENHYAPGDAMDYDGDSLVIRCRIGAIKLIDYEAL